MKNQMLKKFVNAKQREIDYLKLQDEQGTLPGPSDGNRAVLPVLPVLIDALSSPDPCIIAEYKRASPSQGVINAEVSAAEAARIFAASGAAACSVLTEEDYFQGDISYLEDFASQGIPVLRKDFLFHPLQIRQTAGTRSSALLLIVRVVQNLELLKSLVDLTFEYAMEPVVEIFNHQELDMARKSGARVILVNNRDLDRLNVDMDVSRKLIKHKDSQEIWICASGIESREQVKEFHDLGFEAFLIGTSIMSSVDPEAMLRGLIK